MSTEALTAKPADTCDPVPGSLGAYKSVPWCRTHGRYFSTCEAIATTIAALDAATVEAAMRGGYVAELPAAVIAKRLRAALEPRP